MKKALIASLAIAALFVGCATAPVTTGGTLSAEPSGKKVSEEVTSYNILSAFTPMSMETVEQATSALVSKCGGKNVNNVTSQKKILGLGVVAIETLSLSGYCAE